MAMRFVSNATPPIIVIIYDVAIVIAYDVSIVIVYDVSMSDWEPTRWQHNRIYP